MTDAHPLIGAQRKADMADAAEASLRPKYLGPNF
jgi:hypothetical protein